MASTTQTTIERDEDEVFTNPWRRSLDCPQKAPGGAFTNPSKSPLPEPSLELQPRSSTLTFAESTTSTLANPASSTTSSQIDGGDEEGRPTPSRRRPLLSLITFSAVYRTCILLLAFASVVVGLLQYLSQLHQSGSLKANQQFCGYSQSCPTLTVKGLAALDDEEEAISDSPHLNTHPPITENVTSKGVYKRRSSRSAFALAKNCVRHSQWRSADDYLHGIMETFYPSDDVTPPCSDEVHDETDQESVSDYAHLATAPPPGSTSLRPHPEQKKPESSGTSTDRASALVPLEWTPRYAKAAKPDERNDIIVRNIQTYQYRGAMLDPQYGDPTGLLADNVSAYPSQEPGFNNWDSPRDEAASLGGRTLLHPMPIPSQRCGNVNDPPTWLSLCLCVCVLVLLAPIALRVRSGRLPWLSDGRLGRAEKVRFLAALGAALVSWWSW